MFAVLYFMWEIGKGLSSERNLKSTYPKALKSDSDFCSYETVIRIDCKLSLMIV